MKKLFYKKILYLIIFISLFSFNNTMVNAEVCYYEYNKDNINLYFSVDTDTKMTSVLRSFTGTDGTFHDVGPTWKIDNDEKISNCYKYLVYVEREGDNNTYLQSEYPDLGGLKNNEKAFVLKNSEVETATCYYSSDDAVGAPLTGPYFQYDLKIQYQAGFWSAYVKNKTELDYKKLNNFNLVTQQFMANGEFYCPDVIYSKTATGILTPESQELFMPDGLYNERNEVEWINASHVRYDVVSQEGSITIEKIDIPETYDYTCIYNYLMYLTFDYDQPRNFVLYKGSSGKFYITSNGNNTLSEIDVDSTIASADSCVQNIVMYEKNGKDELTIKQTGFFENAVLYDLHSDNISSPTDQGLPNFSGKDFNELVNTLEPMICELNSSVSTYGFTPVDCKDYKLPLTSCTKHPDTNCTCEHNKTDECRSALTDYVVVNIKQIKSYCNDLYSTLGDIKYINSTARKRLDECTSFERFYLKLVDSKTIDNLTEGCDFLSENFTKKLVWVLDLLKIVGPLAALGLGTLDFIKAIASGDADKEMKTAFKRLSTRLIAAALLFVIPVILAFLMDTFLGNQEGYDPSNPFCSVVDWDE